MAINNLLNLGNIRVVLIRLRVIYWQETIYLSSKSHFEPKQMQF